MKKIALLLIVAAMACACESFQSDSKAAPGRQKSPGIVLDSSGRPEILLDSSSLPFRDRLPLPVEVERPDSLTVATDEFDEIWLAAHPLSVKEELLGMLERQTPLGKLFGFIGVAFVLLFVSFLLMWLISIPLFGIRKNTDGCYSESERNE